MTENKNQKKVKFKISSRKLKYGSSAVVFTSVFVAFVILLNVIVSFVDARVGGIYVDMTSKKLYGVSDASVNALKDVNAPIEIIFCMPKDKLAEDDYINPVRMLAESYEQEFSNVSVVYKDRLSELEYFNSFKKTSADEITTYSIIVNCPSTGLSKIYSLSDMYKYNTSGSLFAFDGENKLTTAMLTLAKNEENALKAGFVTGHGESVSSVARQYLEDYGYTVSNIDLKSIDATELATYELVLICNPQSDYIGIDSENIYAENKDETANDGESSDKTIQNTKSNQKVANEIEKLRDYVTEDFGNLMLFFDPTGKDLPEIFSLVEEGFGVKVSNYNTVIDGSMLISNSYGDYRFIGTYDDLDTTTEGYNLHKPVSEAAAGYAPAFGVSSKLEIAKSTLGAFEISSVMCTSENATLFGDANGNQSVQYSPLMTLSKYKKIVDNKEISANVIVCASSGFLSELDTPSFGNADLFKQILISCGNENIVADIDFKVLDESDIEVTNAESSAMLKKLSLVVPALIAAVGIAVFVKRKYF